MSERYESASQPGGHRYRLRTYYEDTDAGGVVYHANYLRFAERARTEALRDAGVPHAEMASQHGLIFMVHRLEVDYLAPARLDDALVVVTRAVSVRPASVQVRQSIFREGEERPLAVLEVRLACVRAADQRPGRVPARWHDALVSLS
ncbi:esterase/thioesterase [Rhodovastum atsumiense]|uniref:Tol-pal system-associated acyl-CoA thioesterase n=1 Tax=Rhodovastum atsumiense TaxID=504468 RepID=A0A5M6IL75_9PROT|nr:tol-pal system-associated acyl-CoA thioesterase [Rhodovastum atsumiense]KAA5609023.1 tol-pal system-associated acyl-CoA thioesterase [Rhodovastum atsumiense]CAH2604661.1 esterase/thioesterase [Rhodovastum atsumiense]